MHVNADDAEACIAGGARSRIAYREQFGKDFLIDLVGYRRYGHNEADQPAFTQPMLYEMIADASDAARGVGRAARARGRADRRTSEAPSTTRSSPTCCRRSYEEMKKDAAPHDA